MRTPSALLLVLALAAPLALADVPLPCASPTVSVRAQVDAPPAHFSTDVTCAGHDNVLAPGVAGVSVFWFQQPSNLTDVVAVLDGPGVHATLPLTEVTPTGGSGPVYESDGYALPSGFSGTITATILHDGVPAGTGQASTLT